MNGNINITYLKPFKIKYINIQLKQCFSVIVMSYILIINNNKMNNIV